MHLYEGRSRSKPLRGPHLFHQLCDGSTGAIAGSKWWFLHALRRSALTHPRNSLFAQFRLGTAMMVPPVTRSAQRHPAPHHRTVEIAATLGTQRAPVWVPPALPLDTHRMPGPRTSTWLCGDRLVRSPTHRTSESREPLALA
jgi:hypothetical protein